MFLTHTHVLDYHVLRLFSQTCSILKLLSIIDHQPQSNNYIMRFETPLCKLRHCCIYLMLKNCLNFEKARNNIFYYDYHCNNISGVLKDIES